MINVHYPSDVVAGLIIGAGGGWLILHRMARGGFGFVFRPNGSIGWRFGILQRMGARGGWISGLVPPLWLALAPSLAPSPLLPLNPVATDGSSTAASDADGRPGPDPAGSGEPA